LNPATPCTQPRKALSSLFRSVKPGQSGSGLFWQDPEQGEGAPLLAVGLIVDGTDNVPIGFDFIPSQIPQEIRAQLTVAQ